MLNAKELQVVKKLKHRVMAVTPIKRLLVFGSRARGDATSESDIDVFIEIPQDTPQLREQIFQIAWEIGFDADIIISTFLVSSGALIDSPLAANPILRAIDAEGIAI